MAELLPARLRAYQAERFPVAAFLPLMAAGAFAALAFSRAARGLPGVPGLEFIVGIATLLVFFFLLRVLDEHKDADVDRRARPELPVPRGLVTLRELRWTAAWVVAFVLVLNLAIAPRLLLPIAAVLVWAGLMGREFFVGDWLRARPLAYLLSHMLIMPLIFLYATSLDWLVAGDPPPRGLGRFLAFAFFNGLVIEIGRKIRPPADEREGVDTYTAAWGTPTAVGSWLAAILVALANAALAARAWHAAPVTALALAPLALAAALPGVLLLRRPVPGAGRRVEVAAGLWVLASYATFGAVALWLPGAVS